MRRLKQDIDWPTHESQAAQEWGLAYYWQPHGRDVAAGFTLHSEPSGQDFSTARDRAIKLNAHLDAWRKGGGVPTSIDAAARFGTVDWWIESYSRT
jgi:hypothetical protein